VHAADIAARDGARRVQPSCKELFPRLCQVWVDMAYRGEGIEEIQAQLGWTLEVVKRPSKWGRYPLEVEPPPLPAFTILPRRWVVGASRQGRCVPAGESPAEGTGQPLVA
jgi:transposase